jgi:hypothetical protein
VSCRARAGRATPPAGGDSPLRPLDGRFGSPARRTRGHGDSAGVVVPARSPSLAGSLADRAALDDLNIERFLAVRSRGCPGAVRHDEPVLRPRSRIRARFVQRAGVRRLVREGVWDGGVSSSSGGIACGGRGCAVGAAFLRLTVRGGAVGAVVPVGAAFVRLAVRGGVAGAVVPMMAAFLRPTVRGGAAGAVVPVGTALVPRHAGRGDVGRSCAG